MVPSLFWHPVIDSYSTQRCIAQSWSNWSNIFCKCSHTFICLFIVTYCSEAYAENIFHCLFNVNRPSVTYLEELISAQAFIQDLGLLSHLYQPDMEWWLYVYTTTCRNFGGLSRKYPTAIKYWQTQNLSGYSS